MREYVAVCGSVFVRESVCVRVCASRICEIRRGAPTSTRLIVLQCVAVCCSVLQCVAVQVMSWSPYLHEVFESEIHSD